jgi:hypothetical protein
MGKLFRRRGLGRCADLSTFLQAVDVGRVMPFTATMLHEVFDIRRTSRSARTLAPTLHGSPGASAAGQNCDGLRRRTPRWSDVMGLLHTAHMWPEPYPAAISPVFMEGSQPVRMSSRTRVRKSTSPNLGSVAISTSAKTPMCSLLAHYWICARLGISSLVPGRLQASASEPKKSRHPQRSGAAKVVTSSKRAGISADFSARHAASP